MPRRVVGLGIRGRHDRWLDAMDTSPDPFQHYRDRFAPLIDHVRRNPTGDLSVEALAREVHFSPYHFHRLFTAVMGETVGSFVQRARLERAVQLMKTTPDRSLTEVAAAAGFSSSSAFSRAFRSSYGVAPTRWDRRSPLTFRASERPDPPAGDGVHDLRELIAADRGPPVEVRLREVPAQTLAYVRIRRPWEPGTVERGYERLRSWLSGRGLARGELVGISWDDVEITPPEHIRYDLAASVPAGTPGGPGVVVREAPSLVVAAATARGSLARVARVWDHLYHDWLPRSRLEPRDLPPFEWFHGWPAPLETDRWDLDCCIPVTKLGRGMLGS